MTEFLNTVLTFPTLVYSVLLAFCTVYWLLAATGIVDFDAVDYYVKPISKTKLKELLKKMGIGAKELLRSKEEIYKTLKLAQKNLSEDEILDLMVKHPDLIQRGVVQLLDDGDLVFLAALGSSRSGGCGGGCATGAERSGQKGDGSDHRQKLFHSNNSFYRVKSGF